MRQTHRHLHVFHHHSCLRVRPPPPHAAGAGEPRRREFAAGDPTTGQGVARGQEVARNHRKKGKKMSDAKVLSGDKESIGIITGSYGANQKEQDHLQNAAKRSAKIQEAMTRHKRRQQTQVTQVKDKTKAKTESATKEAHPAHPAAKRSAAWGIAGTFCARRPPLDPEANAEFIQKQTIANPANLSTYAK